MRINVYTEELTDRIECITQVSRDGVKFYGLRVYLKTVPEMLSAKHGGTHDGDDQSAVTFWFRSHTSCIEFMAMLYDRARRDVEAKS